MNSESDPMLVKVIQKNNKHFSVSITKNIDFWESIDSGCWEPNTFKILNDFVSADCYYLDLGAWIGPTALYAAQLAKYTFAFEPDPIAYQELEANVHANKDTEWASRITIYNKGIASSSGTIRLGSRGSGGDSMSSCLFSDGQTNWEVEAITLERLVEAEKLQAEKLFIKMDIEGGEYELVPRLKAAFRQYNAVLFLSIHPHFLMSSLIRSKGNSIGVKILRRLLSAWHNIKLIRSLPFRYLYRSNGQQVNLYVEILKALLRGGFPTEIVATNKRWNNA
jgi:FkbM family methyltransferase